MPIRIHLHKDLPQLSSVAFVLISAGIFFEVFKKQSKVAFLFLFCFQRSTTTMYFSDWNLKLTNNEAHLLSRVHLTSFTSNNATQPLM